MASQRHISDEASDPRSSRRAELPAFIVLAVLIWPVIAVGFVGAYGFAVWAWQIIFGLPGPPKFLDHRLEMAKREWVRLKTNDSLECRNCHSEVAMDFTRQSRPAPPTSTAAT